MQIRRGYFQKEVLWSNFIARCNELFAKLKGTLHAVICSILLQMRFHFAKRDHAPANEIKFMKLIDHIMWVLQHCSTSPRAICVSWNMNDIADKRDAMRQSRESDLQRKYRKMHYMFFGTSVQLALGPGVEGRIKLVIIASGRFRC